MISRATKPSIVLVNSDLSTLNIIEQILRSGLELVWCFNVDPSSKISKNQDIAAGLEQRFVSCINPNLQGYKAKLTPGLF